MLSIWTFARQDDLPSWWANAVGRALSVLAQGFTLVVVDATHIQVPAGVGDQAAVISISGLWRWNEASLTVAHPGGSAGSYPIYVTASNQSIVSSPAPFTDTTDYSFGLVIRPPGTLPRNVAQYRLVGFAVWDGARILRIDQTVPVVAKHKATHSSAGNDAIAPADIGAVATGDARLSDPRPPAGPAGGDLDGAYPNPTVNATWTGYAPHVHSQDGAARDGNSGMDGRFKVLGGICFFAFRYVCGSTFVGGSGPITFDLPVANDSGLPHLVTARVHRPASSGVAELYYQGIGLIDASPMGSDITHVAPMFLQGNGPALGFLQNSGPVGSGSIPTVPVGHSILEPNSEVLVAGWYHVV